MFRSSSQYNSRGMQNFGGSFELVLAFVLRAVNLSETKGEGKDNLAV